jgi:hypothetical protein
MDTTVAVSGPRRARSDTLAPLTGITAVVLLLAASGFVFLRTNLAPRWFGWITLVLALILLAPWINWVAFFAFGVWVIVASVLLWRIASRSEAG